MNNLSAASLRRVNAGLGPMIARPLAVQVLLTREVDRAGSGADSYLQFPRSGQVS